MEHGCVQDVIFGARMYRNVNVLILSRARSGRLDNCYYIIIITLILKELSNVPVYVLQYIHHTTNVCTVLLKIQFCSHILGL